MEWYRWIACRWISQKKIFIRTVLISNFIFITKLIIIISFFILPNNKNILEEDGLENCCLWINEVRHPTIDKIICAVNSISYALKLFD